MAWNFWSRKETRKLPSLHTFKAGFLRRRNLCPSIFIVLRWMRNFHSVHFNCMYPTKIHIPMRHVHMLWKILCRKDSCWEAPTKGSSPQERNFEIRRQSSTAFYNKARDIAAITLLYTAFNRISSSLSSVRFLDFIFYRIFVYGKKWNFWSEKKVPQSPSFWTKFRYPLPPGSSKNLRDVLLESPLMISYQSMSENKFWHLENEKNSRPRNAFFFRRQRKPQPQRQNRNTKTAFFHSQICRDFKF